MTSRLGAFMVLVACALPVPTADAVSSKFGDIGLNDPDIELGVHCRNPAQNCIPHGNFAIVGVLTGVSQANAEAKTNATIEGQPLRIKKHVGQYYIVDYQWDFDAQSFFRFGLMQAKHLTRAEFPDSQFDPLDELSSLQGIRLAAGFPLSATVRAGFHYHLYQMVQSLYGSYRFRNRPPIAVRGNLVSYGFGMVYEEGAFITELFYNSPYVGKANVDGEDRLATLRGFMGLAPGYKFNPKTSLSLLYGKFLYREDDMFARGIDPNGGNGVFLTGVDLQNHILDTVQTQLELKHAINGKVDLTAVIGKVDAKAVFTSRFQTDDLEDDGGQPLSFHRLGVGVSYRHSQAFAFRGGIKLKQTAKAVDLRDRNNTYGFRFYDQYKESANTISLGMTAQF